MERWLPVKDFLYYEVSTTGRVRSIDRVVFDKMGRTRNLKGKILRPFAVDGYLVVSLYNNGQLKSRKIHQLVAETFIGDRPVGEEVRHLDGNKKNVYVTNLCYGTKKDNYNDMVRHGRDTFHKCVKNRAVGSIHHAAKLTEDDIIQINVLLSVGSITQKEIGKLFGVNDRTISNIKLRKNWKHVREANVII